MKRVTSLAIDERVHREAKEAAQRRGLSLSRFVTEVLEEHLARNGKKKQKFPRAEVFRSGNKYLALDHERYAYGD